MYDSPRMSPYSNSHFLVPVSLLLLLPSTAEAGVREGVVVSGPTVGPDFSRATAKRERQF